MTRGARPDEESEVWKSDKFEQEILALNCGVQVALSQTLECQSDIWMLNKEKKVDSIQLRN